jgi:serine/threonine protein kinase
MDKSDTIFGYLVGKKLGEGSFGEVLLGEKGAEKVAIKKISKKQIIKVLHSIARSTSCTNPSSKRKYF